MSAYHLYEKPGVKQRGGFFINPSYLTPGGLNKMTNKALDATAGIMAAIAAMNGMRKGYKNRKR